MNKCIPLVIVGILLLLAACKTQYVSVTKIDDNMGIPTYDLGLNEFEYIVNCNSIYVKSRKRDSIMNTYPYRLWSPRKDSIMDRKTIKQFRKQNMRTSYCFPRKYEYILPAFYTPKQAQKLFKAPYSIYWLRDYINTDNSRMSQETTIHLYSGKEGERDTTLVSYSRSKLLGIYKRIIFHKKIARLNDTVYCGRQYLDNERWGPPERVKMINKIIIINGKYCMIKDK